MANIVVGGLKAAWKLILQGFAAGVAGQEVKICRTYTTNAICQKVSTDNSIYQKTKTDNSICQKLKTEG